MKVLVTGKGGQLAWELEQTKPDQVELVSFGVEELDISNPAQVNEVLIAESPDLVINAAAYTAVDRAESDREVAYAVNAQGSENLALACKEINARMIHVSTDFVFDGTSTTPYQPTDTPNPINAYGDSKLQGDLKVSQILGSQANIIRTAWLYSVHGNNFVKTMLRLMAEKEQLGVVYDQVGTPTWARGLAKMIWALVGKQNKQSPNESSAHIYHWTDAGIASWYDFAVAIQELAVEKGILNKVIPISPVLLGAYPTAAKRPSYSVFDKTTAERASGMKAAHWRRQLSLMLDALHH
jgi:dTDP-4-dehydrorhamnose reductase